MSPPSYLSVWRRRSTSMPPICLRPFLRAAEEDVTSFVDCPMNANSATKPRMMPIKNLAKNDPVGVLKPRCIMRRGRTWHWTRMRPFLARFSESVCSGHLPSWADFITTTSELKFLVHTRVLGTLDPATYSVTGESYYAGGGRPVRKK